MPEAPRVRSPRADVKPEVGPGMVVSGSQEPRPKVHSPNIEAQQALLQLHSLPSRIGVSRVVLRRCQAHPGGLGG